MKRSKERTGSIRRTLLILTIISCVVFALLPLLQSGYYSDDLVDSTIKGQIELKGVTLWAHIVAQNKYWIVANGRFFPVAFLATMPIDYFLTDVTLHKLSVLVLIVVNLLLFFKMIELHLKDFHVACLGVLLLSVLFQFRLYHDPILSFSGLMQSFMALILISAIMFQKYLDSNHRSLLVASLVSYNLSLYYYEISLPLVLLFPILAAEKIQFREIRPALRKAMPFLVSAAGSTSVNLLVRTLRSRTTDGYSGNTLNLQTIAIAKAFLNQLSATLPLSYFVFDPAHLFRGVTRSDVGFSVMLATAGFAFVYWNLTRKMAVAATNNLFLLGGTLLVFPALMISLSVKYQNEFMPGIGYLPVYIQYFGMALLAIWLLLKLRSKLAAKWQQVLRVTLCAGLSLCFLIAVESNRLVVDEANILLHYRRLALVKALQDGILAQVPENAGLLILDEYSYDPLPAVQSPLRDWVRAYPWRNRALIYQYSGKKLAVMNDLNEVAKMVSAAPIEGKSESDMFLLKIQSYPNAMARKVGYVVLSKMDNVTVDASGIVQYHATPLRTSLPEGS
jgi:hypothetical protein